MYGYLVTGEEFLLQSFEIGKLRIGALQTQWNEFAQTIVDLRRKDLDHQEPVRATAGTSLTNEIRREFSEFISIEKRRLQQRNDQARRTTFS